MEDTAAQLAQEVNNQKNFIQQVVGDIKGDMVTFAIKVVFALVVFLIGALIIHFIRKAVDKGLRKISDRNGFNNVHFVNQIVKFVLYAILVFIIAGYFGASATGIVAVLGSAGLTLGLGFQGALANLAGGFLIMIHKPFAVRDYIVTGNPPYEGIVSQIGMIYTTVELANFKKIQIPNGTLANSVITKLSIGENRMLEVIVPVSYSTDIAKAKSVIEKVAMDDPEINQTMGTMVFVSSLADSSIELGLRVYVSLARYGIIRWRLLENIKLAFDENGIEIPFNQLDVHIKEDSPNNININKKDNNGGIKKDEE